MNSYSPAASRRPGPDAAPVDRDNGTNHRRPQSLADRATRGRILNLARFLVAGLINTGFGYACYAVFILAGASLWLAVIATNILALLFNFASYGRIVFGDAPLRRLPRFVLFYAILAFLNVMALKLVVSVGIGALLAQAVLTPILAAFSYFGMKRFVFFADTTASSR